MGQPVTDCVICSTDQRHVQAQEPGLVCFKDSNRILRWLRELEEWVPVLPTLKMATGIREYQRPQFGSRSPANDAALVHADHRSALHAYELRDGERVSVLTCGCPAFSGCEHRQELGAVAVVASWAAAVREELDMPPGRPDAFSDDVTLLRRQHHWITQQPWVDEYAKELRDADHAVRAIVGDPVPRSQGKCIRWKRDKECKGDVYEFVNVVSVEPRRVESGAKCSKCGEIYNGLDLERFRVAQEAG